MRNAVCKGDTHPSAIPSPIDIDGQEEAGTVEHNFATPIPVNPMANPDISKEQSNPLTDAVASVPARDLTCEEDEQASDGDELIGDNEAAEPSHVSPNRFAVLDVLEEDDSGDSTQLEALNLESHAQLRTAKGKAKILPPTDRQRRSLAAKLSSGVSDSDTHGCENLILESSRYWERSHGCENQRVG